MPQSLRFALLVCAFCVVSSGLCQDVPSISAEDLAEARRAVKQLGEEEHSDRMRAYENLMRLGWAAIEPLEAAMQDEDTEVRLRATEILIALRGRGFLGVQLGADVGFEPQARHNPGEAEPPPFVKANQVIKNAAGAAFGGELLNPDGTPIVRKDPYPAEAAGIESGDRLISVNGRQINATFDLMREIIQIGPARVAEVMVERDGKMLRLPVYLTLNPTDRTHIPKINLETGAENKQEPRANARATNRVRVINAQGGAQIRVIELNGNVQIKADEVKK